MAYQAKAGADLRGLKALVGILGVLIVLGTALVIGVVIKRIYGTSAVAPSISSNLLAGVPGTVPGTTTTSWVPPMTDPVDLPAGSKITGLAAAGGNFAVSVSGPQGDQLWIVNPSTGRRYVTINAPK